MRQDCVKKVPGKQQLARPFSEVQQDGARLKQRQLLATWTGPWKAAQPQDALAFRWLLTGLPLQVE
jgi:hypothetical protein